MRHFLLPLALLAACGASEAPTTSQPRPRLRLWAQANAQLSAGPAGDGARTVLALEPAGGLQGWSAIAFPGRTDSGLESETREQDGGAYVRLRGKHGGLHQTIEARPNACYLLSGRVRANDLRTTSSPFAGASLWLAEASGDSTLEELLGERRELYVNSWSTESALDTDGWRSHQQMFVTAPETRRLHLVCSLAGAESVQAGSVDFADVRLEEIPRAEFWRRTLAKETGRRSLIDPPAAEWQELRRVDAEIGGEHRPSIVLLPGERLRFALPTLASGARLVTGVGPWRPTLALGHGATATLRMRSGGALRVESKYEFESAATGWQELVHTLAPDAGWLEFQLDGGLPLVLGAPLVLTDAPTPPGPNIVLISIDTLRADHAGFSGGPPENTPHLDRLASAGLVCSDTSAQSPYTLPSHATLLTGQFPSVHGVVKRGRTLSAARSSSMAERLGAAGYATRAFTSGGFVKPSFGLDRGFEGFTLIDPVREPGSHYERTLIRRHGPAQAERLLEEQGLAGVERWIEEHAQQRFFLFLHTYTVHDYDPPERFLHCDASGCTQPDAPPRTRTPQEAAAYTPEMRAHIVHLYDAALRYTDERLGQLFAFLEERGLMDNTIVVVTSDHGEEFFEHGALQHGRTLYEELLAIPLFFHGPGFPARVLERPAMLVDVAPTLLARLGFPRDPGAQGLDLLGPAWGERAIWSEVDDRFAHKYSLRREHGPKTIHGPPTPGVMFPNERAWEHFDLASDPGEQQDLSGTSSELAAERAALERQRHALEQLGDSMGGLGHGEVDEGTLNELSELGYGGVSQERDPPASDNVNPLAKLLEAGHRALLDGRVEAGIELLERALGSSLRGADDNALRAQALGWLGHAYTRTQRLAEAQEALSLALSLDPAHVKALEWRGYTHALMGEHAAAIQDLTLALETLASTEQAQIEAWSVNPGEPESRAMLERKMQLRRTESYEALRRQAAQRQEPEQAEGSSPPR